jgi:hypothetical protein
MAATALKNYSSKSSASSGDEGASTPSSIPPSTPSGNFSPPEPVVAFTENQHIDAQELKVEEIDIQETIEKLEAVEVEQ